MEKAVEAVNSGQTFRQAAEQYRVNKDTLYRVFKKKKTGEELQTFPESCRSRQVFSQSEEEELVEYIIKASRIGFPVDTKTLRRLAYQLAERNTKKFPDTWETGRTGEDWLFSFQKRHHNKISSRTPESTSIARATVFNRTNVKTFFDNMKDLYGRYGFEPGDIYNPDETGLQTSQKPQRVVAEAGVKQVAQMVSHERGETVTMLGFINAIGNSVPPCLIFPRVNFRDFMMNSAPPGACGFASRSGWMTKEIFLECLHHFASFAHRGPDRKVLLILDNHESHVSLDVVDFCREKNIVLLSFPPHTSLWTEQSSDHSSGRFMLPVATGCTAIQGDG
ncbi:uncharacterized protein LOC143278438 [Babylonia areolata]|uniref:uncharacterized protein LOC143278438 n=1 Tax=Babylonia areolata TaxID=304850 RepID=UPI003FD3693E